MTTCVDEQKTYSIERRDMRHDTPDRYTTWHLHADLKEEYDMTHDTKQEKNDTSVDQKENHVMTFDTRQEDMTT